MDYNIQKNHSHMYISNCFWSKCISQTCTWICRSRSQVRCMKMVQKVVRSIEVYVNLSPSSQACGANVTEIISLSTRRQIIVSHVLHVTPKHHVLEEAVLDISCLCRTTLNLTQKCAALDFHRDCKWIVQMVVIDYHGPLILEFLLEMFSNSFFPLFIKWRGCVATRECMKTYDVIYHFTRDISRYLMYRDVLHFLCSPIYHPGFTVFRNKDEEKTWHRQLYTKQEIIDSQYQLHQRAWRIDLLSASSWFH